MNTDALWAELDELFSLGGEKRPGEVSYHDIMDRYNVPYNVACRYGAEMLRNGWKKRLALSPETGRRIRVFYRE